MEQFIEFMDFENSGRGRRLNDNTLSVWYNLKETNNTFGVTFASNIKTDKKNLKIGKIGDKMCFVFTNEPGISLNKSGSNVCVFHRQFVEFMFPQIRQNEKQKDRIVFELMPMGSDVFVIKQ
jgi:hypothetical protein